MNPIAFALAYAPADQLALAALFSALLAGLIVGAVSIVVDELRA